MLAAPRIELVNTPDGMGHVRWMADRMAKLAAEGSHDYGIRQLATAITRNVPSKAPTRELFALYKWVRDEIRYRHDPLGLELLQSPARTVEERAGDCDDIATLLAALCGALGHPWRFRTVGPTPDEQAHVQLQAHDKKRWIDLDPVLEPEQATTAPRNDPGRFGAFAVGAEHLWSQEGKMLRGPTTYAERLLWDGALGGPTSARDRELWEFCPYFPPVGPPYGGQQPPMPGAYPTPDPRYRSANAPGFINGQPASVVYHLPPGSVASERLDGLGRLPVVHPTLGAGWLKKVGRGLKKAVTAVPKLAHQVTHTGPIAKVTHAVEDLASKTVILKPFVDFHRGVSSKLTENVMHRGGLIDSKAKVPTLSTALSKGAAAASAASGGKVPKQATRIVAAVPHGAIHAAGHGLLRAAAALPHLQSQLPTKGALTHAVAHAVSEAKHLVSDEAWKKPHAELRKKYPAAARMLFDPGSKRFRIFVPKAHGLHGIIPTLTFTLGAAPSSAAQVASVKAAAAKLESAVKTFMGKHSNRPPAIALPAITSFQKAEGTLKQDGLYGTNTKAAAEYYLGHALPDHAKALTAALTWKAPGAAAPAPQPAPKPVVVVKPAKPHAATKPAQPTPVVVVKPAQPAKPVNALPVPSGYTEVGNEANNPGLPPIGYDPGQVVGGKGTTTPDWVSLPPSELAILQAHAGPPDGRDGRTLVPGATFTVVPTWNRGDPLPSQRWPQGGSSSPNNPPSPNWVPAGQLIPSAPVPPLPIVDVTTGEPLVDPDTGKPLTQNDFPGHGGTYVDASGQPVTYGPVYGQTGGSDDSKWWWLGLAFIYYRSRQNKRHAA